ncbi:hypothetical protein BDZ94DRAFT_805527 [Collybia nuda]|uniref:DUF6699 domain-containing protein n=1 Tax=Collybia nuda TaxID=64659 RepID=A0A9P6CDA0_9AGAR|nr:hypothetical protein BDZ94DRAFT_805527 [Collybia nuda]
MIHDEVWCSASPDSRESQIMDEFTDFYFSEAITSYLNSTSGEVPFDIDLPPSYVDDSPKNAMRIRGSREDPTPSVQRLTPNFRASYLGGRINPKQREADTDDHYNISDTRQADSYSFNASPQTPSRTLVMALGSSSGVASTYTQKPLILTPETQIITKMHPELVFTTNPKFQIDLSDARTIAQQTSRVLSEGATMPLTASLEIVCPTLPWKITITPRERNAFVTVSDVLNGMYSALQRQITDIEFSLESPKDQRRITEAYRLRCKRFGSDGKASEELSKGVKRIDFLHGKNRFLGFSLVEQPDLSQPIWLLSTSS